MKIIKVIKRVGESVSDYEYLATVDFETDVTKYGHESLGERYQTKIFPIDILEGASNFHLFEEQITHLDYQWWKENLQEFLTAFREVSRIIYRFGRWKLKYWIVQAWTKIILHERR